MSELVICVEDGVILLTGAMYSIKKPFEVHREDVADPTICNRSFDRLMYGIVPKVSQLVS